MLGHYEKRYFEESEKLWLGRYENLTNVLHWHFECEIIRIVQGCAQIKIGDTCFDAAEGDCFFCNSEQLHYIISQPHTQIDIGILDTSLTRDITEQYCLLSPKLSPAIPVWDCFDRIKKEQSQKGPFYREAIGCCARTLLIDIFRNNPTEESAQRVSLHNQLIRKINDDFAFITFSEAARYCGYSPSHFSKLFRKLSGMHFSEYLNIIKVENAISFLCSDRNMTISDIAAKCGFSTVRNFNRVFKKVTGHSPRTLPKDFTIDTGLRISTSCDFDPTDKTAVLI